MKLVIMRSRRAEGDQGPQADYLQEFNTRFAERVIGNLLGGREFCTACESECGSCRAPYKRQYGDDIAAVIDLPAIMPYVLEEPEEHVPSDVPDHQVLLIIGIHEQVLLKVLERCQEWGTKGVVVPLEGPGWASGATRALAKGICDRQGIEISFPKPFCAFRPPGGTVLDEFRQNFHIGYPHVELSTEGGIIREAVVKVSAACGATYYVARGLPGRSLDENLEIEVISKRMHSYPCMASMERDPELHDDTAMHIAGQAHNRIVLPESGELSGDEELVVSPMGRVVRKPIPAQENRENIEQAKRIILELLANGRELDVSELRKSSRATPAAMNSALLLLKKECRVVSDGGRITLSV